LNMRHNRNLYRPCSAGCHPSLRLFAPQNIKKNHPQNLVFQQPAKSDFVIFSTINLVPTHFTKALGRVRR
jgi:hypothetical protein